MATRKRSIATVPKQQPKPDTLPVLRGLTDQYQRRHFNYSSEMPAVSLNLAPH